MKNFVKVLMAVLVLSTLSIGTPLNNPDSSTVSLIDSNMQFHLNEFSFTDSAKSHWYSFKEFDFENFLESKQIWIRLKLPEVEFSDPALLITGAYTDIEVYLDSLLIFKERFDEKIHRINLTRSIVPVENIDMYRYLIFRTKYPEWYNAGEVEDIRIGEINDLMKIATAKENEEIASTVFNSAVGAILILLAVLSLFFYVKRKEDKFYPFITFAIIALVSGLDHFVETTLGMLIPLPLIVIITFQISVLFILPVAFIFLIKQLFGSGWKNVFNKMWKFHTGISLLYTIAIIIDSRFFLLIELFVLIVTLEIISIFVFFFKSRFQKQKNSKFVFYATFIFMLFAINDLLLEDLFGWDISEIYGVGIIVIALSLVNVLLNNYSQKINEAKEYQDKVKEKELELANLKKENLQSQYDALKNQVNPHFLFNTFSTLMNVIQEDQENGVQFVQKLSNVYRYVLQSKDSELVSLDEELNFINAYMFLLEKRFDKGLIYEVNIPDDYKNYFVIPLSLQILIENCIKHNIVSDKKPLKIEVSIHAESYLSVKNNLQTKTAFGDSTKIGLENIKNRYRLLAKKEVIVNKNIESFEVIIPLIKNNVEYEYSNN